MMTDHDKWIGRVVAHLNKLIQLDFDASLTYKDALVHIDDAFVRADLEMFLQDHERHVMELSTIVRDLGGEPIAVHRDLKGAVLESLTKLRSRTGTLGALRAMRTNEKLTNRVYDREAEVYMPPIAQAIVMENLEDERRHLAAIQGHIDRLSHLGIEPDRTQIDQTTSDRPTLGL
jgi:rubrerythrin